MARLKILLCAVAAVCPAALQGASIAQWRPYAAAASERFGIPMDWIMQVMRIESGGQTMLGGRLIRSSAGAIGLMQIMPKTWAALSKRHALGDDPDEPRANIMAGAAYLREMHDRFGYPGLFAAYNAGPSRYARYLSGRVPLPRETLAYVKVMAGTATGTSARKPAADRPIVPANRSGVRDERHSSSASDPLFFVRRMAGARGRDPAKPRTGVFFSHGAALAAKD
ncbi:lytic transglycosylase domain-containing protein [Sphingobium boeckii]|uniref:Soluble lytic murein transglycosylase-like protein n=1 Tax=Sphingobium boeckii TaxID=1082345 RepID=A0A7W9ED88_9SPHN|nr:lytic transglycosylase domain-containing protein [Sphingobium boeckii]MBB5685023.1 soluble lytic murein transglycosylase-like protein [Sphingobium boeckii]